MPKGTSLARWKLFAELYLRYSNATRAAKEAGYSEKTAYAQGSRLLKRIEVKRLVEGSFIDRIAHAEQTYRELITVKDAALKTLKDALLDPNSDVRDKCLATETAARALERLARIEGLMLPPVQGEKGERNLQQIVQIVNRYVLESASRESAARLDWRSVERNRENGGNGAASDNGNGHA